MSFKEPALAGPISKLKMLGLVAREVELFGFVCLFVLDFFASYKNRHFPMSAV